jgi:hypothetical protein
MILLYSTNTLLAFRIAEKYYGQRHYVWCTPCYSASASPIASPFCPPTSAPRDIYFSLLKEVLAADRHSTKIRQNRLGLTNGARQKRLQGVITEDQFKEINALIKKAEISDFRPLLYVIPYSLVQTRLKDIPEGKRASSFSAEYLIEELPRDSFDVLELTAG